MGWFLTLLGEFAKHLFQTHPKLVVFILLMCATTFGASMGVFAQKSYVDSTIGTLEASFSGKIEAVQEKMVDMQQQQTRAANRSDRNFLLLRIADMEREMYDLEAAIEDDQATPRDRERLVAVRTEYNEANRQLRAMPVN